VTVPHIRPRLAALLCDCRGTMVIETAIVAPVLVLLSIGAFEASSMVTRQSELQSAAAEAVAIVMAATPKTETQLNQIEAVVENSTGLADEDVVFAIKVRCDTEDTLHDKADLVADPTLCDDEDLQSWFIRISMTDHYTPIWVNFGVGTAFDYHVDRMVQLQ